MCSVIFIPHLIVSSMKTNFYLYLLLGTPSIKKNV